MTDAWEENDTEALAKDLTSSVDKEPDEGTEPEDFLSIIDDDDDDGDGKQGVAEDKPGPKAKDTRFQQRIDQLTRDRNDALRRAAAAEAATTDISDRLNKLETGVTEKQIQDFKTTYEEVRSRLVTATEEGDTNQQVALMEKLADMRAAARVAEARESNIQQAQRQDDRQHAPAPGQPSPPPPEAMTWWNKNRWFNAPGNEDASTMARAIDVRLEQEGFDKNDPSYYIELDNRLQVRFPELYTKAEPRRRSPAAASTGGRGGKPKGDNRLRLTREELSTAQELGLSTKEELTEYAKEVEKNRGT
ncbi:MAG TPA: hypothetical protein VFI27_04110 [candidate division Zixibacteria bacterium]|nr:hypothetical protein [candidate division Zixibacteria bacterium]HUU81183.1 hypothetical protein [Acidobacteriota bacterium]